MTGPPPLPAALDGRGDRPCLIVRDHNGQALAFVYCEDEPGRPRDEARRIALNIAKLPELLGEMDTVGWSQWLRRDETPTQGVTSRSCPSCCVSHKAATRNGGRRKLMTALLMSKLVTALFAACVVASKAADRPPSIGPAPPPRTAASEPTSMQCHGRAISPTPGTKFDEVSLFATFNYDQTREVALIDDRTGQKRESPFRQETPLGPDELDVLVNTGSLTVEKVGSPGTKVILRMLWQKAGMSQDFIGFAITLGYTSVLQVDSWDYGEAPKGTQMPFNFFDGLDTILYKGTCAAR
jgi:hypothetical protein